MQWIAPTEKDAASAALETRLSDAADQFRANSGLTPQQYSGPILGLIFLRLAGARFAAQCAKLEKAGASSRRGSRVDEPAAYHAEGVQYFAPEVVDIGARANAATREIAKQDTQLAGVLSKTYSPITSTVLKTLRKEISDMSASTDRGTLRRIREYILGELSRTEGQMGGEFCTPSSIVRPTTEVIEPFHGRILGPVYGSGGMSAHSEKFIEARAGKLCYISLHGKESSYTTWWLAHSSRASRRNRCH